MVCYEEESFVTKEQINGKQRNQTMFSLEMTQNWHTSRRCSPALTLQGLSFLPSTAKHPNHAFTEHRGLEETL